MPESSSCSSFLPFSPKILKGSFTPSEITVAAILQLPEAGKLDIDARLATYLPTAPHASEITRRRIGVQHAIMMIGPT